MESKHIKIMTSDTSKFYEEIKIIRKKKSVSDMLNLRRLLWIHIFLSDHLLLSLLWIML